MLVVVGESTVWGTPTGEFAVAVGTLVLALATVVLAVVALSEVRRARRQRPSLSLSVDEAGGWDTAHTAEGKRVLFLRLLVLNEAGKDSAADVQVVLLSVEGGSGLSEAPLISFGWTHTATTRLDVPSGSRRLVDFFAQPHGEAQVWLWLMPHPINEWWKLDPGTYVAHLELSARNADAVFYDVEFLAGARPELREIRRVS